MERAAARFYRQAMTRASDASIRKLLGDLAEVEDKHDHRVAVLEKKLLTDSARHSEEEHERRRFILQIIQPGLVGLMDGSVSTLAPVFAAAFATHNSWNAFVVGLAASIGAGISMGFAEALSDDGKLSGRGAPLLRGLVCGLMTVAGGIGHTLPFLIPHFYTGDRRGRRRRRRRTHDDLVGAVALHGRPALVGRGEGDGRGSAGAGGGHPDRGELKTPHLRSDRSPARTNFKAG